MDKPLSNNKKVLEAELFNECVMFLNEQFDSFLPYALLMNPDLSSKARDSAWLYVTQVLEMYNKESRSSQDESRGTIDVNYIDVDNVIVDVYNYYIKTFFDLYIVPKIEKRS